MNDMHKTAQELKQHFLDIAHPLIKEYVDAALGRSDLNSTNPGARAEVWEVIKKLILESSDKMQVKIETVQDIIVAVGNGSCTLEEGEKMLSLYQKVKEIEMTGKIGTGGGGGLTINIKGPSQPAIETKVIEHE